MLNGGGPVRLFTTDTTISVVSKTMALPETTTMLAMVLACASALMCNILIPRYYI